MSEGSHLLAHATHDSNVMADVCRSIVGLGDSLFPWIGYVEHDEATTVRNVACSGLTEFVDGVYVSWGDNLFDNGPAGTTIKTTRVQINVSGKFPLPTFTISSVRDVIKAS
ncbi:MAG: hypothetical protein ACYDB2_06150 [Acidimicrobiales bacterium]